MTLDKQDNEGYRRFWEALQQGRLTVGSFVTQSELSDALGLSITPLRETLVLLEEYGLVEIKPRSGIRIVYPEVSFIRENYQFRIMIEVHALRTTGDTLSEEWLASMRVRHEECRSELTGPTDLHLIQGHIVALDRKFHHDIVEAMDNRPILDTHGRLQDNIRLALRVHQRAVFRAQLVDTIDEHMRIIESLEKRDIPGAIANLEAHFRASTHRAFAV
jgi:DNA-binding GntR family transcriptional regulator